MGLYCQPGRSPIAGSRDALNISSVVAKGGGGLNMISTLFPWRMRVKVVPLRIFGPIRDTHVTASQLLR